MTGSGILEWSRGWSVKAERFLWPVWPTLFIAALWLCVWDVQKTLKMLPRLPSFLVGPSARVRSGPAGAEAYWPALQQVVDATNHYQAWLLGVVITQLDAGHIEEQDAITQAADILLLAGQEAGQRATHSNFPQSMSRLLTRQSLHHIGQLYRARRPDSPSAGAVARLAAAVTIANVFWVVGAVGMAIAFFPALSAVLRPLTAALLTAHYLLLPFYGLLCYSLWLYMVLAAARCHESTAPFVAFTGGALALATYFVLGERLAPPLDDAHFESRLKFWNWFTNTFLEFGLLLFVPLTVVYSSRLLGFAAASFIYVLLQCWAGDAWVWLFGPEERQGFLVTSIASGVFVVAVTLLDIVRLTAVREEQGQGAPVESSLSAARAEGSVGGVGRVWWTAREVERAVWPFHFGLSFFGCGSLLLTSFCWGSTQWWEHPIRFSSDPHMPFGLSLLAVANVVFVLETLALLAVGAALLDATLTTISTTGLVLWCVNKLVEASYLDTWVAVFLGSCAMVGAAWWAK